MTLPGEAPPSFWTPRILGPFALVALIWGSTWLVIKDQIGSVPASWSVTWRFTVAAAGVLMLALARRESLRLDRRGHRLAMLLGLLQFVCNFQFVYRAEQHITSGIVAVLFALLLVPNALFARIFLGQPLTRGFLAGSAIAIAGIALLLLHEVRTAPVGDEALLGVLFAFCGILSASSANVLQASEAARTRPMLAVLFWAMAWGVAIDATFAWTVYGPPRIDMRPGYLLGIAYLGVMGSVVTFPLYFQLVRELGPGRAAYNGVLVPVVAMLLSTLFEGYRWSALAVAGAVLAIAGLIVALRARSPSR